MPDVCLSGCLPLLYICDHLCPPVEVGYILAFELTVLGSVNRQLVALGDNHDRDGMWSYNSLT